MKTALEVRGLAADSTSVSYLWDHDTDILTAQLGDLPRRGGRCVSVDLEGSDGSWIILDVADGRLCRVEVAVWPTLRKRTIAIPPCPIESTAVRVGPVAAGRISTVEIDTLLLAEVDHAERILRFRLGRPRGIRTVRVARQGLLDIDTRDRLAGLWLLEVPPLPVFQ